MCRGGNAFAQCVRMILAWYALLSVWKTSHAGTCTHRNWPCELHFLLVANNWDGIVVLGNWLFWGCARAVIVFIIAYVRNANGCARWENVKFFSVQCDRWMWLSAVHHAPFCAQTNDVACVWLTKVAFKALYPSSWANFFLEIVSHTHTHTHANRPIQSIVSGTFRCAQSVILSTSKRKIPFLIC